MIDPKDIFSVRVAATTTHHTTMAAAAAPDDNSRNSGGPTETLPGNVPSFIVFFLPNLWGILLAILFEYVNLEEKIVQTNIVLLNNDSHPFALLGFSFFVLINAGSYLSGCVVCARLEYDVKLPNLYADKRDNKHAVIFNCIQRGHQNFLENFQIFIASAFFTGILADRPNTAGLMLLIVTVGRIFYAKGYKSNTISARFPFFLLSQFAGSVGVGYAALMALSAIGIGPFLQNNDGSSSSLIPGGVELKLAEEEIPRCLVEMAG